MPSSSVVARPSGRTQQSPDPASCITKHQNYKGPLCERTTWHQKHFKSHAPPKRCLNLDLMSISEINEIPSGRLTRRSRCGFLDLAFEIREQIYSCVFPRELYILKIPDRKLGPTRHQCAHALILCNRQMHAEIRAFLTRRGLHFCTVPDSYDISANVSCLHMLNLLPNAAIRFEINPFQYIHTIPSVYEGLTMICQSLTGKSAIPRIVIDVDGTLPRDKPPFYVNEFEVERALVHIIVLLAPFRLLYGAEVAEIAITGGPLTDPWIQHRAVIDFKTQLEKTLCATSVPTLHSINMVYGLRRELPRGLLWDIATSTSFVSLGIINSPGLSGMNSVSEDSSAKETCSDCSNNFLSRNQLFMHLISFHYSIHEPG